MATCLVTGGAGFIGSHIVEALVRRGDRVRVLDNFDTGRRENLSAVGDPVEWIIGDVEDGGLVRQAVEGVDVVYHQAAIASVGRSLDDPLKTHRACVTGTLTLLMASRDARVRRVIYAASSSAYGNSGKVPSSESDLPGPLSPYAAAKLAAEHYCEAFTHSWGLETVCLRYFNIFGPRQDPRSPYSGVVALFISSMLKGERPTIHGDGKQSRDFTYIDNAVDANLQAAEASGVAGKVYNVGCGRSVSILELAAATGAILGTQLEPQFGPPRVGDVRHSQADIACAQKELGYQPRVSFEDGLRRTIDAYRATLVPERVDTRRGSQ